MLDLRSVGLNGDLQKWAKKRLERGMKWGRSSLNEWYNRQTQNRFLDKEYGPWVVANRKTGAGTLARLQSAFSYLLGMRLGNQVPDDIEFPEDREQRSMIDLVINTFYASDTLLKLRSVPYVVP